MSGGTFGIDKRGFALITTTPARPEEPLTLQRIHDAVGDAIHRVEEHARIARDNARRLTPPAQSVAK